MPNIDLVELNSSELKGMIKEFYDYFTNPFHFEKFLKFFFEKVGFDEVERIGGYHDHNVDLRAVNKGLTFLGAPDTTTYIIQAKRYKYENPINERILQQLKGTLKPDEKGILVTTSRFTKDAKKYVEEGLGKGIISLIDGQKLIQQCIDLGIGFIGKPIFNSNSLDKLMRSEITPQDANKYEQDFADNLQTNDNKVLKSISKNDIRSKILPIPKSIYSMIPESIESFDVVFHETHKKNLKINRTRKYFGGVTEIYREYGLITANNVLNPTDSYWSFESNLNQINVEFHNN